MKHRPEYDLKIIGENLKRLREENGFSMVYRSVVLDETMEIEVINFAEYKAQCQRRCLEYARHYQHYLEQKSAS